MAAIQDGGQRILVGRSVQTYKIVQPKNLWFVWFEHDICLHETDEHTLHNQHTVL